MSAVVSVLQREAGYLLADAAAFYPDGRLYGTRRKVTASIHMPAAVTFRGVYSIADEVRLAWTTMQAKTPMDLMQRVAGLVHKLADDHRRREPDCPEHGIEATGVFWGEDGPVAFIVAENALGHPNAVRLGPIFGAPEPLNLDAWKPWKTADDVQALSMPGDGLAIMQMQRAGRHKVWEGEAHIVGGWCDCATVTAAGATVETLHVWDDKIGEKIAP